MIVACTGTVTASMLPSSSPVAFTVSVVEKLVVVEQSNATETSVVALGPSVTVPGETLIAECPLEIPTIIDWVLLSFVSTKDPMPWGHAVTPTW